ncbi:SLC13 family permease [Congregibacter litoralis]|uniref:Di-and tricarboxylate transporter n=1 Tax=Congregibacter litoralis KT71 TaxID=314285 RepID=A4ACC7_9GAMM|nr:SLC13 family permease [Congregibacter litoralis]EAQ96355.1 Di- and tricarboxylate transporter [Congregibacter litoralis KT71]
MPEQLFIAAIFLGLFYGLVFTSYAPAWLFSGAMGVVYFAGLVDTPEVLDKATNIGLVTLVLLLLVSVGLEKLSWLSRLSRGLVVGGYRRSLLRVSAVTSVFSALVNNTAVVATLANALRENNHHLPSRLLLPLSYAAVLGGTTTLIGTSTNLIVSSFLEDATGEGLAFFDFLPIGLSVTVIGIAVLLLTHRLLPANPRDEVTVAEYLVEAEVVAGSSLIGRSIAENGLRELEALFLVEIVRGDHLISPVAPQEYIAEGDRLIFSGDIAKVSMLERFDGLATFAAGEGLLSGNLVQVILLPGATVEGKTVKDSGFRSLFDAAVVGIRRGGERLSGKLGTITLQAGDSLMLAIGGDFYSRRNVDKNFLVVGSRSVQKTLGTTVNTIVGVSMLAVVASAALGLLPLIKGLLGMLVLMLALGVVRAGELRRRFPFDIAMVIGSALVLSQALVNTGLVSVIADGLHLQLASKGPYLALVAVYLATLLMTELMTNNAAAALVFPIAFGLAESFGLSAMPFVMAVAYGASASFMTPYGYTTNLMVQNIGNYRFVDYLRYGFPLSVVYSVVVLVMLPRVFPFAP